jgi:hypothetical protein
MHPNCYKKVSDNREPILIDHAEICYPPANPEFIDKVDTSYPGIVIDFNNDNYLIEDGCHRIAKLQQNGIFKSLFYVVSIDEYKKGMVYMICGNHKITLGEWNHNALEIRTHN